MLPATLISPVELLANTKPLVDVNVPPGVVIEVGVRLLPDAQTVDVP